MTDASRSTRLLYGPDAMMEELNSKQRPAITSIRMVNFKNFVDETLRLGPLGAAYGFTQRRANATAGTADGGAAPSR